MSQRPSVVHLVRRARPRRSRRVAGALRALPSGHTPEASGAAWGNWVVERLDLLVGGAWQDARLRSTRAPPTSSQSPITSRAKGCACLIAARRPQPSERASIGMPAGLIQDTRAIWTGRPTAVHPAHSTTRAAEAFAAILREEAKSLPASSFPCAWIHGSQGPWPVQLVGGSAGSHGPVQRDSVTAIQPGMIYAGLAGATRSARRQAIGTTPSGRASLGCISASAMSSRPSGARSGPFKRTAQNSDNR